MQNPPLISYPARPVNGGRLEDAPPKVGPWIVQPKIDDWRAIVHTPSKRIWNRHGEPMSINGDLANALMILSGHPLETRKQILQSRRWDIVRKQLIDLVMASKAKDVTVDVVDLVPIFGFHFNSEPLRNEKHSNRLWAMFDARKKKGFQMPKNDAEINYGAFGSYGHESRTLYSGHGGDVLIKDRDEAIWHGLKRVIVDQLLHIRLVSEIIAEHAVTDIERIGKLLKFDTTKAKKEADLQIAPPKTWGKVDVHTLAPLK